MTNAVTVSGIVYSNQLGAYTLTYAVKDLSGNEAVEVSRTITIVDTIKPVITMLGDHPQLISQGSQYGDPGVTAIDSYEGNLSGQVVVRGTVNTNVPGLYTLTYEVADSSGNKAEAERSVHVRSNDATLKQLAVNVGKLLPTFNPEAVTYNVNVDHSVQQVTLTIQVNEQHAKLKLNNEPKTLGESGAAEAVMTLKVGQNTLAVEVTAQDGSSKTYTLRVHREDEEIPPAKIPPATDSGVDVLVNGKVESAGKATVDEVNGQRVTSIQVDEEKMQQRLNAEGHDAVITIPVAAGSDVVIGELNGRMVAIPEGIDPNRITTGVVVEQDGTVRHVPTKVVHIHGKYFAQINSLTNSTYSVVWHPLEFKDVANHWANSAVNNMGSRMVVSGTGDDMFSPDRDITRAEFAAIIVHGNDLFLPYKNIDDNLKKQVFTKRKLKGCFDEKKSILTSSDSVNGCHYGHDLDDGLVCIRLRESNIEAGAV